MLTGVPVSVPSSRASQYRNEIASHKDAGECVGCAHGGTSDGPFIGGIVAVPIHIAEATVAARQCVIRTGVVGLMLTVLMLGAVLPMVTVFEVLHRLRRLHHRG